MDILELLKGQIGGPLMERMGGLLGLDAAQAQTIGQAVLPVQLAVIQQQAGTEAGAAQLLGLVGQLPQTGAQSSLETPEGLAEVRQSGTALLPQLLGSRLDDTVQQIATQTGTSQSGVLGMMQMVLPLVLGVIGQQAGRLGLNAGSLGSLFTGGAGTMGGLGSAAAGGGAGLGAAAVGLGSASAAGLSDNLGAGVSGLGSDLNQGVSKAAAGIGAAATGLGAAAVTGLESAGTGAPSTDGRATVSEGAGMGGGVVHTNPALGGRRGMGWLWLLPLLLLLLLGGCFLLRGKPAVPLTLTEPANGAAVTGPFAIKGTGTAGQEILVSENGQQVGKTTVAEDGTFSADVPAPSAGDHTYALSEAGAAEPLNLMVKAAVPAVATPAQTTPTQTTPAAAAQTAPTGAFAVTAPAAGASLPAGAFDLKGTGKPGEMLEVFEDGVSLGKVTVGEGGTWSLSVPSPAAGAHTYTVKGPDGAELGSVQTTIAAGTASAANCTKAFSLSIPDGQTVAQPFRFGGVGSGKSYTVTVMRGERKIGSKLLPLDSTCAYSYTSKPGKGTVSYSVAPTGSADVAGKITLTVN